MAKVTCGAKYLNLVDKYSRVRVEGNRHYGIVLWTWPQGVPSCRVGYVQNSNGEDFDSIDDLLDVVRTCRKLMGCALAEGQFQWRKTTVEDVWRLVVDNDK